MPENIQQTKSSKSSSRQQETTTVALGKRERESATILKTKTDPKAD